MQTDDGKWPPRGVRAYYADSAVCLIHGDCRDILPQLDAVDHVMADPPYARDVYVRLGSGTPARLGVAVQGATWTKRHGAALQKMAAGDIGSIDDMLEDVAEQIARVTKRWAIVFSDAETTWRWRSALTTEPASMRYVRTGAWVKPNTMPQMSGDRPAVGFEPCTIVHANGPMRWNGGGKVGVWTYGTASGASRPDHPCPKPEQLMVELVSQFTDPGDLILDPFGGSGTTAVAAKRLGRRCIVIEKEEKYCEVAARRLSQSALDLFGDSDRGHTQETFGDRLGKATP